MATSGTLMNETLGGERLSDLQDGGTITRLRT